MNSQGTVAPVWTPREFEILVGNYLATNGVLANEIPNHQVGAVATVRRFIHAYHLNLDTSGLSQMMLDRLARSEGLLTCPVCKSAF